MYGCGLLTMLTIFKENPRICNETILPPRVCCADWDFEQFPFTNERIHVNHIFIKIGSSSSSDSSSSMGSSSSWYIHCFYLAKQGGVGYRNRLKTI